MAMIGIDTIINFAFSNIGWIIVIGLLLFILNHLISGDKKKEKKPISRYKIEKDRIIEREKYNKPKWKFLYRGEEILGKIESLSAVMWQIPMKKERKKGRPKKERKDDEKEEPPKIIEIPIIEMVVRPIMKIGFLVLSNPFKTTDVIRIDRRKVTMDRWQRSLRIPIDTYLDYFMGVYYDQADEEIHVDIIKNRDMFRTDLDNIASIYVVKSQEQTIFQPSVSARMVEKEKDIQHEETKRKAVTTQI